MYSDGMEVKGVRMCHVGFYFFDWPFLLSIKINELCVFCAVGNTSWQPVSKTNEIANVCASDQSFIFVMEGGVSIDNVLIILLTC